ncbi:MAG: ABC transporter permease subunit [Gaiellales bacterium]
MSVPAFTLALRLRLTTTASAALGLIAVMILVGALFPAVGGSIGKLNLPKGATDLLGGADYGTITGWYRSEIGSVYGPLVIGSVAIMAASGSTAGEEDDRILGLVLAQPVTRARLVLGKAAAAAVSVLLVALATWVGLVVGVAVAGGGISVGDMAALSVHLAFFGFATGAVALALGAGTGRRGLATGIAAGVGILGYLINGLAPLVDAMAWLRFLSPFYYYAGQDPLARGVDVADLAALAAITAVLTGLAVIGIRRRDLRG